MLRDGSLIIGALLLDSGHTESAWLHRNKQAIKTIHKMELPPPNSSSQKQTKPIRRPVLIVNDNHDGLHISPEAGWSLLTVTLSSTSGSTRAKM